MENPGKFDGKSSTTFKQWWESVTMYLGFYLETVDRQKIAWVGTLLTDTTLVWHLHRYWELQDNSTWANYLAAIRTKYRNEQEAANAQLKLDQLRNQGSIRTYMTEFRALNNFARATGEAIKEMWTWLCHRTSSECGSPTTWGNSRMTKGTYWQPTKPGYR